MAQSTVEYPKRGALDVAKQAPIQVLHVDDEAGFLKAAKQILEMQGAFEVNTASSVEEANGKMKEKAYDAIVCDYIMPGKDGLQFLKELRDSGNNIPFVIFTGKGREEVAIKALNLGADRYFNKIGDPETVYCELTYGIRQAVKSRRAEKALRASEERHRSLLENARDTIIALDLNGNVTFVNRVIEEYGFKKEEVVGKNMAEFIVEKYQPKLIKEFAKVIRGKTAEGEIEVITPKGKIISEYRSNPIRRENRVIGSQTILRDITERKKAEEALRASEEKLRNIFQSANDCIFYLDKSGRIIDVNQKAVQLFGRSRKEIFGRHFAKLRAISPKHLPTVMKAFANSLAGKQHTLSVRIKDKSGQSILLECSSSLIKADGKIAGMLVIARDITERKQMEEKLKESEEKHRNIVELAPDGIMTANMKGVVTSVNPAFLRLTGFAEDEIVGKHLTRLPTLRVNGVTKYIKMISSILRGKIPPPTEGVYLCKDGNQGWAEARIGLLKKDGKTIGIQAIVRDITERKKTTEKLKFLNEKLNVVGKLTRHDVRNKLSTVTTNTFLIKQKLADNPEALKHLSEVESACGDVEKIFEFARIYEKLGAEELVHMDIAKTLDETVRLFSDLHNVVVVNDCRGLTVLADSLLRQLFYNLIDNSLKHGEKVSQIRVHYEETGKDKLKLVYEDDGVGIPKAEKEKIFTEGYGKGSGYGLYLIRKMCGVYGWTIRETGKQRRGAQFAITIPKLGKNGKINH